MSTKLTLRLEESLIEQAKAYAQAEGRSVSQLVGTYFASLAKTDPQASQAKRAPLTQKLRGSIKGDRVSELDYRSYLEDKFR